MNFKKYLLAGILALSTSLNSYGEMRVEINLPSYELKVYDEKEIVKFNIRVGKPGTPTPIGEGIIKEKRDRILFRYLEGKKKGEVIRYSYLDPEKRTIKMPYEDMRGLQMVIEHDRNLDDGKIIHSTTDYWTIGFPVSHGCIGMKIDDMLELYDIIQEVPVPLNITYETIFVEDGDLIFYADIYNKGTNSLENLVAKGITIEDSVSAKKRLDLINKELKDYLNQAKKELSKGKNPEELKDRLHVRISISEFLQPF